MVKNFKIFENQVNLVKSGIIPVKRWCNKDRENTDELRGGTLFSYKENDIGDRYKNNSDTIGGGDLITGKINFSNPAVIKCETNLVLSDWKMFERLGLFEKSDKEILYQLDYLSKSYTTIKNFVEKQKLIPEKFNLKRMSGFVISNIVADRLLTKRLIEKKYDCFIWLNDDLDIHEIFDFKKKFIKD